MMKVVERSAGYYEVQRVPHGKVYTWHPEHLVIECDCGERLFCTGPDFVCRCGTDHAGLVRELTSGIPEEDPHPWDHDYRRWLTEKESLHPEYLEWAEIRELE